MKGIYLIKCLIHKISLLARDMAINSNSIENNAIHDCFLEDHATIALFKINNPPLVDLEVILSLLPPDRHGL